MMNLSIYDDSYDINWLKCLCKNVPCFFCFITLNITIMKLERSLFTVIIVLTSALERGSKLTMYYHGYFLNGFISRT